MNANERDEILKKWDAYYKRMVAGSKASANARQLNLDLAGVKVTISLLEEAAPRTASAFLDALPVSGHAIHARWSGDMILMIDPISLPIDIHENARRFVSPGDVCYCPRAKELSICYGVADARMPTGAHVLTVFGRITSGFDEFAAMCVKMPVLGAQKISLQRAK